MFASPAFASAGAAGPSGAAAIFNMAAPLVIIFVIFYFLLIRPQQRRLKQHRDMIDAVKKNDTAITGGGLIGKVTRVDENEVELEVASGVKIKVVKAMLSDVRPHGAKPAND
jgi:preprotein translocase subunit YajC